MLEMSKEGTLNIQKKPSVPVNIVDINITESSKVLLTHMKSDLGTEVDGKSNSRQVAHMVKASEGARLGKIDSVPKISEDDGMQQEKIITPPTL